MWGNGFVVILHALLTLPTFPYSSLSEIGAKAGYHLESDEYELVTYAEARHEKYLLKTADDTYSIIQSVDGEIVSSQFGLDKSSAVNLFLQSASYEI